MNQRDIRILADRLDFPVWVVENTIETIREIDRIEAKGRELEALIINRLEVTRQLLGE